MGKNTEYVKEEDIISFNVFESKEIDLSPAFKPRRRRQVDDYDYNDPFFESFEGELDPVDIECNLENFFVYKGNLSDNPKKIAKRYTKELAKQQLQASLMSIDGKVTFEDTGEVMNFSFEKVHTINNNSKYKKEPAYANLIFWLFCYELDLIEENKQSIGDENKLFNIFSKNIDYSAANIYADHIVLMKLDKEKWAKDLVLISEKEKAAYLQKLGIEIENAYKAVLAELNNMDNFGKENMAYKNFKSEEAMYLFIRFYMVYIKYYSLGEHDNVNRSRNRASDYMMASFPSECTNNIKLKYYVRKAIEDLAAIETDYGLEQIMNGVFIKNDANNTLMGNSILNMTGLTDQITVTGSFGISSLDVDEDNTNEATKNKYSKDVLGMNNSDLNGSCSMLLEGNDTMQTSCNTDGSIDTKSDGVEPNNIPMDVVKNADAKPRDIPMDVVNTRKNDAVAKKRKYTKKDKK